MKCVNCDNKIKQNDTYCSNCGINLKNVEVIKDNEKKSNTIFYIGVILLLLISISFSTWILLRNDKKENNKDNKIILNENEVLFKGYILTTPEGFEKSYNDKNTYIQSNDLIIFYKEYTVSFEKINNNKELLTDSLKEQGYIIENYEVKKTDDKEYIVIYSKLHDVDYCLLFYEIDSDTNIFLTITSNYSSKFKNTWIEEAINFIKTSKKI